MIVMFSTYLVSIVESNGKLHHGKLLWKKQTFVGKYVSVFIFNSVNKIIAFGYLCNSETLETMVYISDY